VDAGAFEECPALASVSLPSTLTTVGYSAFQGCKKLASIALPAKLNEIGESAFSGCEALKAIEFPASVTSLGDRVCQNCSSLKKAALGTGQASIPSSAFANCASLQEATLPSTIEWIGNDAFQGCKSLPSINIPSGVTEIGGGAFADCDALNAIALPNSVKYLRGESFRDCDALKNVVLSTGIERIEYSTFQHCDTLQSIILPYKVSEVGDKAFAECTQLKSVTIPRGTEVIADNAFSYPEKITIYGVAGTYAESYAKEKSIKFVAHDVPATSITFDKPTVMMRKYDTTAVAADVQPLDFTGELTWKSSNNDVVTVDENGNLQGVGTGETTVKLVVGDQYGTVKVAVVESVSSIEMSEYSLSLEGGQTAKLTATVFPEDAYNKEIVWSSSDESVVTVGNEGLVTAMKKGNAFVRATAKDGSEVYGECAVEVVSNMTAALTLSQLESAHPYEKDSNELWSYSIKDARALDVTFDSRSVTEEGSDYISLYSGDYELVGTYTGSELAGKTVRVAGDRVIIRLQSDNALNEWGFKVLSVNAVAEDGDEPKSSSSSGAGESGSTSGGQSSGVSDADSGSGSSSTGASGESGTESSSDSAGTEPSPSSGTGASDSSSDSGSSSNSSSSNVEPSSGGSAEGKPSSESGESGNDSASDDGVRPEPTAVNISSADVSTSRMTYAGRALRPVPVVTLDGKILSFGRDYSVEYANNINAGIATLIVTGVGSYSGTAKASFQIDKADNPMKAKAKKVALKAKKLKKKAQAVNAKKAFKVTKAKGKVTYKKVKKGSAKQLKVSKAGKVTVKKGTKKGTYKLKVKITAKGNANYKAKSKTVTVKVVVR